jgi:hypothetical protein
MVSKDLRNGKPAASATQDSTRAVVKKGTKVRDRERRGRARLRVEN